MTTEPSAGCGRAPDVPLASIIIPTHNRARLVAEAVASALAQTYPALEVIVADDGSTDDTREVLRGFGARIQVLAGPNRGVAHARNDGLRQSRGDLITFLDDDDLLAPEATARRARLLQEHPETGIVYSDLHLMEGNGAVRGRYSAEHRRRMPSGDLFEALLPRNFIPLHAMLWRRSVLERTGGFIECAHAEDWECLVRAAEFTPIRYLDEPLGFYRLHDANATHQRTRLVGGYGIVQERIAASERFSRLAPARRARVLTRYAAQQWLEGDPALARRFLRQARRAAPLHPWPLAFGALRLLGRPLVRGLVYRWWRLQAALTSSGSATSFFRRNRGDA